MRRMLWAGLLALPLVLTSSPSAQAQGCATGNCPPGFGYGPVSGWGGPWRGSPWHCGAFCMKLFGALHQEGPLFNYGPYTGYYPFEPYGPWTSDLRYVGGYNCTRCGLFGGGCGPHGCGRLGGLFHRDRGCDSGGYALTTFRNVFSRLHPFRRCDSGYASASDFGQVTPSCSSCVNER